MDGGGEVIAIVNGRKKEGEKERKKEVEKERKKERRREQPDERKKGKREWK